MTDRVSIPGSVRVWLLENLGEALRRITEGRCDDPDQGETGSGTYRRGEVRHVWDVTSRDSTSLKTYF